MEIDEKGLKNVSLQNKISEFHLKNIFQKNSLDEIHSPIKIRKMEILDFKKYICIFRHIYIYFFWNFDNHVF
jgi:hypothetical protein